MIQENETYAYFTLAEFEEDPDEITNRLGVTPSNSWRKGDAHPKTDIK